MNSLKNRFSIIIVMLFNFQFLFSQEVLKGEKVFEAFFGGNPENLNFRKIDFELWGPTDFWSENNEYFYIADAMAKSIKKFNKSGSLIWQIPLDSYPMYIWQLNDLSYVSLYAQMTPASKKFRISRFNRKGSIISNSNIINWPVYTNSLHLKCGANTIYVETETHAYVLDYDLNVIDTLKRFEKNCYYLNNEYLYVFKVYNFRPNPEIIISKPVIYSNSVKTYQMSFENNIYVKDNRAAIFRPLGTDAIGNFYISRLEEHKPYFSILKYSNTGDLIAEKMIKIEFYAHGPFNFKVMLNGDIYTQNTDEKRYWIERYPAELFKD